MERTLKEDHIFHCGPRYKLNTWSWQGFLGMRILAYDNLTKQNVVITQISQLDGRYETKLCLKEIRMLKAMAKYRTNSLIDIIYY